MSQTGESGFFYFKFFLLKLAIKKPKYEPRLSTKSRLHFEFRDKGLKTLKNKSCFIYV